MPKLTPFLWFDNNAEEAIRFYLDVFPGSRIVSEQRKGSGPDAPLFTATFELEGQRFTVLNGGPHYKLNEAFSLFVDCETQSEVDELWSKLLADGGKELQCGWLTDRFGLTWQIIPRRLMELLGDPDPAKSKQVMEAMLKMQKIDIAALERAYESAG